MDTTKGGNYPACLSQPAVYELVWHAPALHAPSLSSLLGRTAWCTYICTCAMALRMHERCSSAHDAHSALKLAMMLSTE